MLVLGKAGEDARFVLHLDIQHIDQLDRAFLARVIAAADHMHAAQRFGRNAQFRADGALQILGAWSSGRMMSERRSIAAPYAPSGFFATPLDPRQHRP
jgi:hypothetical protein